MKVRIVVEVDGLPLRPSTADFKALAAIAREKLGLRRRQVVMVTGSSDDGWTFERSDGAHRAVIGEASSGIRGRRFDSEPKRLTPGAKYQ